MCRSKSGGAHIFFFFKEWMDASDFRDKAAEIAAGLGHGRCEIFQNKSKFWSKGGDVGNFINLPYFDAHKTFRYAVIQKKDGYIEATLEEFIEEIQKANMSTKKFMNICWW